MQKKLRIVFMGTPDFAVASLRYLKEQGHSIAGVITAPDKPAGRGKKLVSSPVKTYALEQGIEPILQPANLKDPEFHEELRSLQANIQVVVAFRMLPEVVWAMPPLGTINLHASLLPDYRGAAPINWAIINGETETGVTTFFIEKEIDTGKIILNDKLPIHPDMTAGEAHDLLMDMGARLLDKTLRAIASGDYQSQAQSELMEEREWHDAPKIFKEDCRINWQQPAEKIHNFIRGLSPYPSSFTEITDGKEVLSVKIFKSRIDPGQEGASDKGIATDGKKWLRFGYGKESLSILELQLAGKKRMPVEDLLRGFQTIENFRLKG
jgi:methionyl-tRNA formyltransferase